MVMNGSLKVAGALCALVFATLIAAAQAAVVWDLNPNDQNAALGSNSHTFTNSGFSITAYGFDNHSGIGVGHELFYKNQPDNNGAVETGLGLRNTPNNEIQPGLHFIQFDFTAALAAGMLHGQISVGSVQQGETFAFFGSNTLGTLGSQVGGPFNSASDNQFISIPGFGQFNYYSVVALNMDVLPVAIQADLPVVPEMNAILPIAAFIVLLAATNFWRKRRALA